MKLTPSNCKRELGYSPITVSSLVDTYWPVSDQWVFSVAVFLRRIGFLELGFGSLYRG